MRYEIGQASILGFIPGIYPAGVFLGETFRNGGIEKVTGIVDNIETDTEWRDGRYFSGPYQLIAAREDLINRATSN
jgi:hypothetical protein